MKVHITTAPANGERLGDSGEYVGGALNVAVLPPPMPPLRGRLETVAGDIDMPP